MSMKELKKFANEEEKKEFLNSVAEVKRSFGFSYRRWTEAGIECIGFRDAEGEDGVPYVVIRYTPIRMEMVPDGEVCLQEYVECDLNVLKEILQVESQRSVSDRRAMFLRAFDILARSLSRIGAPIVLVFGLAEKVQEADQAVSEVDRIILEYDEYKKIYPLSYAGYKDVKAIVEWYEFLWSSGVTKS